MQTFLTYGEIRTLGAPVVRLFQVALGRDPDPADLADFAGRLRQGAGLVELAQHLVSAEEFRRSHGPGEMADEAFSARLCARLFADAPGGAAGERSALIAAALATSRAELIAAIANSAQGRARIPLMPGLAPGAPPDDPIAYRLWVEEYQLPLRCGARPARAPRRPSRHRRDGRR